MWTAVDVIDTAQRLKTVVVPPLAPGVVARIVVSGRLFWDDVRASFASDAAVRAQADLDVPRCEVYFNGVRQSDASNLPNTLACTQAVMGLAVEALHRGAMCVCAPTPLCVRLTDTSVVATKAMHIYNDGWQTVWVTVEDSGGDVVLSFSRRRRNRTGSALP